MRQLRKRIININLFSPGFWQAPQARPLWSLWWSCVLRNRGLPGMKHYIWSLAAFWATYQSLSQTACMNLWRLQTVASRQTWCKQLHCILVYCIHMYFWILYILYIHSTYIASNITIALKMPSMALQCMFLPSLDDVGWCRSLWAQPMSAGLLLGGVGTVA